MVPEPLRKSRFGLGLKLSLFVTALVLVVSSSLAFFLIRQSAMARKTAMSQQVASLGRMVGSMRGTSLEREVDPGLLKLYVEQAHNMGTNLCFALFLDADGKLDDGYLNSVLLTEAAPELTRSFAGKTQREQLTSLASGMVAAEQVREFRIGLRDQDGRQLGSALLGFSTVEMNAAIQRAIVLNLIVTGIAFLLAVGGTLIFSRQFVRPIRLVAAAMQGVSAGQLELRLDISRKDEVGTLADSFNFMVQGLRDRERIRNTFARYVSDQVAERILEEDDELDLTGELREVTVLFLDIRGFTALTEFLRPREVVALLNDYFGIIIEIIFRFEGTVNKFIGDSIMAIYGAPASLFLPELRAVLTAVEIQRAVGEYNWRRMQEGKPVVNFGIGIHSGEAIAGNIGSALRMEYTVIGRDVNLAQRIESTTREGQVLISESTAQRIQGLVDMQKKEAVHMKGIVDPIQLYEVTGVRVSSVDEARAFLRSGREG
jgi:class 3 adenylate cyclase